MSKKQARTQFDIFIGKVKDGLNDILSKEFSPRERNKLETITGTLLETPKVGQLITIEGRTPEAMAAFLIYWVTEKKELLYRSNINGQKLANELLKTVTVDTLVKMHQTFFQNFEERRSTKAAFDNSSVLAACG